MDLWERGGEVPLRHPTIPYSQSNGCQAYTVDSLCFLNLMSQPRLSPDERVKAALYLYT
ncbi:hypothetical protein ACFL7M_06435 [Thermodesulfobacteriota bacterium]